MLLHLINVMDKPREAGFSRSLCNASQHHRQSQI